MDVNISLKDDSLASSGCGGEQSFVCLWAEGRSSFSFSFTMAELLGPQLRSFSSFGEILRDH